MYSACAWHNFTTTLATTSCARLAPTNAPPALMPQNANPAMPLLISDSCLQACAPALKGIGIMVSPSAWPATTLANPAKVQTPARPAMEGYLGNTILIAGSAIAWTDTMTSGWPQHKNYASHATTAV